MTTGIDDEVLTLEDLAELLKVSDTTAYALVRSRDLPGRKWRFLKSRVYAWLAQAGQEGDGMANGVVQRDEHGGEHRTENGREYIAMWLPITRAEKAAQLARAERDGVNVSGLVARHLREWVSAD